MASCLLIKNDGIGDLICSSGVISGLASLYDGQLDLLTCIQNKEIAERIPGVRKVFYVSRDEISSCQRSIGIWKKIPWLRKKNLPFSTELMDWRVFFHLLTTKYDMAISLRRFIRYSTAVLMRLTRANEKFCCWNIPTNLDKKMAQRFSIGWQLLAPCKEVMWEPLFYRKFLDHIFPDSIDATPALNLPEESNVNIPDGSIGCIICDSTYRSWSDSYWDTFLESLLKQGRNVYLFGPVGDRTGLRRKYAGNAAIMDCCGSLGIMEHIPYFRSLSAIVSEDTGLAHLAALCGGNVLVLQASGNCDGFFFPWMASGARTRVIAYSMSCNGTSLLGNRRSCEQHEDRVECIWRVTPNAVLSTITDMLLGKSLPGRIELNDVPQPLLRRINALPVNSKDRSLFGKALRDFACAMPPGSSNLLAEEAVNGGQCRERFIDILLDFYRIQKAVIYDAEFPKSPYVLFIGSCMDAAKVKRDCLNRLRAPLAEAEIGLAILNTAEYNSELKAPQLSVPSMLRIKGAIQTLASLPVDALDAEDAADYLRPAHALAQRNLERRFSCASPAVIRLVLRLCDDYLQSLFALHRPAMLLLWNKFNAWQLLVADYAAQYKIPVMYMEFGPLPGSLCFEPDGQMGESFPAVRPEEFNALPVSPAKYAEMEGHLNELRVSGANRNVQPVKKIGPEIRRAVEGKPVVLYAGQNDFESGFIPYTEHSRLYHSPVFPSSLEALKYLDILAQKNTWALLYKPHPYAPVSLEDLRRLGVSSSTGLITDISINEIVDFADVTLTILSTVCYIALIRKKPVVMMGYTQLRHAGATYDAFRIEDIEPAVKAALTQGLTAEQHANFVTHAARMSKHYLYGDGTDVQYHSYKGLDDLVPEIIAALKKGGRDA